MTGSWWRGRPLRWNPDEQAIEQERQRWVYERVGRTSDLVQALAVDPDREYAEHRQAYIETGDPRQLDLALKYVRP